MPRCARLDGARGGPCRRSSGLTGGVERAPRQRRTTPRTPRLARARASLGGRDWREQPRAQRLRERAAVATLLLCPFARRAARSGEDASVGDARARRNPADARQIVRPFGTSHVAATAAAASSARRRRPRVGACALRCHAHSPPLVLAFDCSAATASVARRARPSDRAPVAVARRWTQRARAPCAMRRAARRWCRATRRRRARPCAGRSVVARPALAARPSARSTTALRGGRRDAARRARPQLARALGPPIAAEHGRARGVPRPTTARAAAARPLREEAERWPTAPARARRARRASGAPRPKVKERKVCLDALGCRERDGRAPARRRRPRRQRVAGRAAEERVVSGLARVPAPPPGARAASQAADADESPHEVAGARAPPAGRAGFARVPARCARRPRALRRPSRAQRAQLLARAATRGDGALVGRSPGRAHVDLQPDRPGARRRDRRSGTLNGKCSSARRDSTRDFSKGCACTGLRSARARRLSHTLGRKRGRMEAISVGPRAFPERARARARRPALHQPRRGPTRALGRRPHRGTRTTRPCRRRRRRACPDLPRASSPSPQHTRASSRHSSCARCGRKMAACPCASDRDTRPECELGRSSSARSAGTPSRQCTLLSSRLEDGFAASARARAAARARARGPSFAAAEAPKHAVLRTAAAPRSGRRQR